MKFLYVALVFFYLTNCFGSEINPMKDTLYQIPENCDFSKVENNEGVTFDCTPKLTPKYSNPFIGIIINSPTNIVWDKDLNIRDFMITPSDNLIGPLRLMISGLLQVPDNTLSGEYLSEKVIIVAVNTKTAKVFSGRMRTFGFKPDSIEIEGLIDIKEGKSTVKEVFNVDLVQNLNIPLETADYIVYAVLGDYKSNVREVKVRVE